MDTATAVRPSRMVRPNTDGITLRQEQRPIDYGHCHQLLMEKYGEVRGDNSYEAIGQSNNGGPKLFVVGQEIQKEKIRMILDLNNAQEKAYPELAPGPMPWALDLDSYDYFQLWTEWKVKGLYKGK